MKFLWNTYLLPSIFCCIYSMMPAFFCFILLVTPALGKGNLRIILAPEKNAFELRSQYKKITDFLAEKLGENIYLEVLSDYTQVCPAFDSGRADAAFLGGYSYLKARRENMVEPLVRPVWTSGEATSRGYVVVRKESMINSVALMKDKKLMLVARDSATGYFFPLFYFYNSGIVTLEKYFSSVIFGNNHDTVVWSVFTGESDIGAVKSDVYKAMVKENPKIADELDIVARSPTIPTTCFVVKEDMPEWLRDRLLFLFLQMDKVEDGKQALADFGGRRFIRTVDADFELLRKMVAEFKLEHMQPETGTPPGLQ